MSAKYPRTPHLPWSPGGTKDDRRVESVDSFIGRELIITEKVDGSNLCMTRSNVFARSHGAAPGHISFDYAKGLHAGLSHTIDNGVSLFGEYCYAVHSIAYTKIDGYFLLFGARDDTINKWYSWDDVELQAMDSCVLTVPVLWRGMVDSAEQLEERTNSLCEDASYFGGDREGVVVRLADSFADEDFSKSVAKWVRANHVQTDDHWKSRTVVRQRVG